MDMILFRLFRKFHSKSELVFGKHEFLYKLNRRLLYSNYQSYKNCDIHQKSTCNLCKYNKRLVHTSAYLSKKFQKYVPKTKKKEEVIEVWKNMTVSHLAKQANRSIDDVYEAMLFVENCENYSEDNAVLDDISIIKKLAKILGFRCKIIGSPVIYASRTNEFKDATRRPPPEPASLVKRTPVVTIMGHVDHGKTTLLDTLRHTSVVEQEFGGITQHIGAFTVNLPNKEKITFLDTPGHAAFSAMRARGANVTDIVVLVVAADDGVMEQTVESIKYAKEAEVPIIVAINKIDKPNINIEYVKTGLLTQGVQLEDMGGDVQAIPISALKGTNLDQLIEAILIQAEIMEIKGDPKGLVEGVVIESTASQHRGKLSTALIQRGTLRNGAILVAGTAWAKVRAMFDEWSKPVQIAPPGTPVQIMGWRELPNAGDEILEIESEQRAREVLRWRENQNALEKQKSDAVVIQQKLEEHLQKYKSELKRRREEGRFRRIPTVIRPKEYQETYKGPKLSVIIKGDVDGSVEAILDLLETYNDNDRCYLDLISYGVGSVTENDIELAKVFNGIIYGFNVTIPNSIHALKKKENVVIKEFKVIYHLFNDIKEEINTRLPLVDKEEVLGEATVLQEFMVTLVGRKKVPVAGCLCNKGLLKKEANYRLIRGTEVVHEGKLGSLRHQKDEVKSIKKDVECGIRLENPDVRFQAGDTFICYEILKVEQKIDWDPGF
ncbi:translation initiation factor IF-2, mitochondrial [Centruroides vittatus]|uniref:translation initiation factor IF-2, mitochondrial n=1 Tax=Centruroides vittatus TaxID=120091 RepID=UPI0035101D32